MEGIKETKELLKFVIELGEGLDKSLQDGELGFTDLSNLVSAMMASGDAFENANKIPAEIKDLDENEALELYTYVREDFNLINDKTEEIVERSLEIGLKIFQLVEMIRAKPPTTPADPVA